MREGWPLSKAFVAQAEGYFRLKGYLGSWGRLTNRVTSLKGGKEKRKRKQEKGETLLLGSARLGFRGQHMDFNIG